MELENKGKDQAVPTGLKKLTDSMKGLFAKDLKLKLIVLAGILGMALILLSQLLDGQSGGSAPADPSQGGAPAVFTTEEYIAKIEDKLQGLITEIEGVGKARVMVTLANSGEYVYAQEEKRSLDKNVEPGTEDTGDKINSRENVQQSYILVDTGYGQKEPLIRTQLEPKIQGVVIVCEGAGDVYVRQSLINVVTTALNLPTTRVCVEKISG